MKRLSVSVIWLLFVAYFTLLMGGAHGAVLCFGENGHLAIEAAQNGGCGQFLSRFSPAPSPSHETLIPGPAEQHCGPCLDFVLSTMQTYRMTAPLKLQTSPKQQKTSPYTTDPVQFSKTPQEVVLSLEQLLEHHRATLLQTTVLLI